MIKTSVRRTCWHSTGRSHGKNDETFTISGIGIDHDVSEIYPNAIKIKYFGDIERAYLPLLRTLFAPQA